MRWEPFLQWGIRVGIALIVLVVARLVYRFVYGIVYHRVKETAGEHVAVLSLKLTKYGLYLLAILFALTVLGVNLGAMLTALGLFSVAVGFAAQTSVSNLISGIFLLFDRPFQIGDAVDIGGNVGIVLSIDLLSTKLRTFDNVLVRIPNEAVLKASIRNFTAFEIRRIDVQVGIAYKDDPEKARQVIQRVLDESPYVLKEPGPMILVNAFGESSVDLIVRFWVNRKDFLAAKDAITVAIKKAFEEAGIEIPFPQRVVYLVQGEA